MAAIFETAGAQNTRQLGADEFLPLLVYIVAKCGFFSAEIEAEYMWGLLNTSLVSIIEYFFGYIHFKKIFTYS